MRDLSSLTICTVTYFNDDDLKATLSSINYQSAKPAKVIVKDGQTRPIPPFISLYELQIDYIAGPDKGIYDAMNKALQNVATEYVLFLNSGDELSSNSSLSLLLPHLDFSLTNKILPDVLLLPWRIKETQKICFPSLKPLIFNHQSVVYRTSLHADLGPYLRLNKFTAADYLFFYSCMNCDYQFAILDSSVFSQIDPNGASSSLRTPVFVAAIHFMGGAGSRLKLVAVCLLHPSYHWLKFFASAIVSLFKVKKH